MKQSDQINELLTALSKAQGMIKGASANSVNPHFKSKYADLSSVWEACRDALSQNGLSIIQFPCEFSDNRMFLTTRIGHSSGQWLEQTMSSPVDKPTPQGIGSVLSYMRRYALSSVVGISQLDDDANEANIAPKERPATLTADEQTHIKVLAETTDTDLMNITRHFGKQSFDQIERLHYATIVKSLEKKITQIETKLNKVDEQ